MVTSITVGQNRSITVCQNKGMSILALIFHLSCFLSHIWLWIYALVWEKKRILLICAMATGLTFGLNRGMFNDINISLVFYSKVSFTFDFEFMFRVVKGALLIYATAATSITIGLNRGIIVCLIIALKFHLSCFH